jgi:hypothetical protein
VTPDEAVAYMELIRAKAATAAPACADALGNAHKDYVQNVTLVQRTHAPLTWTDSPRGGPPADLTGKLRRSITCTRAGGGGMVATSAVAPHTIYAGVQEFGAIIHAHPRVRGGWTGKYMGGQRGPGQHTMHFVMDGENYFPMVVDVPQRPYMRPSRNAVIATGLAADAANAAFLKTVFG